MNHLTVSAILKGNIFFRPLSRGSKAVRLGLRFLKIVSSSRCANRSGSSRPLVASGSFASAFRLQKLNIVHHDLYFGSLLPILSGPLIELQMPFDIGLMAFM